MTKEEIEKEYFKTYQYCFDLIWMKVRPSTVDVYYSKLIYCVNPPSENEIVFKFSDNRAIPIWELTENSTREDWMINEQIFGNFRNLRACRTIQYLQRHS